MKQIIIVVLMSMTATLAQAQHAVVFTTDGIAIKGYDVVAFFKEMKPVRGIDSLTYTYMDARWLFSSRKNMEAFKANPEQYMPQYGGYCAYGTADGHEAPTEIETWTIVDGKLYFNYNQQVKDLWMKDQRGLIQKANMQWPLIKDQN